jgi:hypothetical protein
LEVHGRVDGSVDGELSVVGSESVTLSVGVREETGLENRVGSRLDSRNEVRGREGNLFNLSKVVLGVLVEDEVPNRSKGELSVRPDLGQIKNVVTEFLGLLGSHGLNAKSPGGELLSLNSLEEILTSVVGVVSSELSSNVGGKELDALVATPMELGVNELSGLVDKFVSVSRVSVHVSESIGNTTVTEEDHDLMESLRVL